MNVESRGLGRRDLLRIACLGGLSFAIPLTEILQTGGSNTRNLVSQKSTKALGTTVTITVNNLSPPQAEAGIDDALSEVQRLERALTRFQPSGQVSRLNSLGQIHAPTFELLDVLGRSRYFSERTEGAFDITVKPALDLLQIWLSGGLLPSDADFERARNLVNFELVHVSRDVVSFGRAGMGITLDCIGKGYVLDKAAVTLRAHGIRSALVQGGGTLVAVGTKPDGSPWRIGVRDPSNPYGLIAAIDLVDGAVATSGDYENFFSPDRSVYHIVDPTSAHSPLYSHSATVTAPTAAQADPLGVALMIKEPSNGLKLLENFGGCECLIATRIGKLVRSSHFGVIP